MTGSPAVSAKDFNKSTAYNLLLGLSTSVNKRTPAPKPKRLNPTNLST